MFNEFWDKQRNKEPDEPKMISLCKIFEGSGEDMDEIIKQFNSYMIPGEDYDIGEEKEMIGYLVEIAKDRE